MNYVIYFIECVAGGMLGSFIMQSVFRYLHIWRMNRCIANAEEQAEIIRERISTYLVKYHGLKTAEVVEFKKREEQ